ncbi:MAG TPA: glycosyltransferase family A protein [Solirubrobacteraceae bacterium]|jgi:glycosyltransferase involved in cell wall biosynthesis|nr:glycosyltransferase family A protein [Solirubrobacteraceae bacterium]
MKFSILLPTRNRLEYLKLAVESVRRQGFRDWELVISDNCSEEDIAGYLGALDDPRIRYSRTDHPVPVTENWNRALTRSSGDYIIMLGDDDALTDGYLSRMDELIGLFSSPDVIYTKSLLFTYPGVDPAHPAGYLIDHGCAEFFTGASRPFELDRARALDVVRAAMRFQLRYDFNAQFALISRRVIESLEAYGSFYQSAFPDYYSMNAAFLRARSIVVDPVPGIVIGRTPKSYGYFQLNDKETEGRSFLDGAAARAAAGTNINVGWLSAAAALEQGVARDFGLRAARHRYRFAQATHVYKRYRFGEVDRDEVRSLERELPRLERWLYRAADRALALVHRVVPRRLKDAIAGAAVRVTTGGASQMPSWTPTTIVEGRYRDVLEVCDAQAPGA